MRGGTRLESLTAVEQLQPPSRNCWNGHAPWSRFWRERSTATNAARDVLPETIADFHRIGLLRIIQPRRFGGLQLRFCLFSRIVEIITEGCASAGWVYAVLGEHQWLMASYPVQAQIDVWGGNPLALASSSLAPRAVAARTAGGWRLSGQYSFSSGSTHAHWAIVGAFLGEAGDPAHDRLPARAVHRHRHH